MKKIIVFSAISLYATFSMAQQYWQQEVNYKINVSLDDQNHYLRGFESIEYVNNSPNVLEKLNIHLWPNAYRSRNSALAKQLYKNGQTELFFGPESDLGWIDSLNFKSEGAMLKWDYDPEYMDICILQLAKPLRPGERITIETPFKVKIPSGEISRLGHVGQSYQITQWYPKPAVYDKNGWNQIPYLNQGEFYSEYGSFDVTITLPENYVVGATGDLQTQSELDFLSKKAKETESGIGELLTLSKPKASEFPTSSTNMKTIRYTQYNVHDFAWFADKRYAVLKGEVELPQSKRKVTSWAMFVPSNAKTWQHAIEYINDGTYYYSLWNGDYPYNQVTAVDGTISAGGGMEYPNVTVIGNASSKEELEVVIVHEVGHNWFYGILGSNERVHGWMDEGMNTLNEMRYIQTKYPNITRFSDMVLNGKFHLNDLDHHDMGDISYRAIAGFGLDQPIETHSAAFTSANYGIIMYQKTGLVFFYLKDYLGEELFDKAMHEYYEQWKFKHPQPEDMKKAIESSTGKNLSWLFTDLIQTTRHIDYKIQRVKKDKLTNTTQVTVKNVGQVQGPIEVNAFMDKKDRDSMLVETKWAEPAKKSTITFNGTDYTRFSIDVSKDIPEFKRSNNHWNKKLFPYCEPLKGEFLIGDHDINKTNFFWTPSIGGNAYDGFMFGGAIHNLGIPFKPFQFVFAPQFSTGRLRPVGMAEFSYTFLPATRFKSSKLGMSIRHFGTGDSKDAQLVSLAPYLKLNLGNRGEASPTSHDVLIQGSFRKDDYGMNGFTQLGGFLQYNYNVNLTDHRFDWKVRYEYANRNRVDDLIDYIEPSVSMNRVQTEMKYKWRYLRNKQKRWMEVRAFTGWNLATNTDQSAFLYSFGGAMGDQDIYMEEYYFGRFQPNGFWSNQRMNNMGGFNTANDQNERFENLSTVSIYSELPYIPKLFGVFVDAGIAGNKSALNAGVGMKLGPVLSVYFPLYRAGNALDALQFNQYGREIRFSLKMNLVNSSLRLGNLF